MIVINITNDRDNDLPNEIWKDIKGYEGYYQVSNLGRIRSIDRYIYNPGCFGFPYQNIKGRIIKPYDQGSGHLQIILSKEHKCKNYYVHRLVMEAFTENPDNFPCINHKDENGYNNELSNLEWCDHIYNINYGTCIQRRAENHWKRIDQYDINMNYIQSFNSITEASESTMTDRSSITKCAKLKRKTAGGYIWRYNEESCGEQQLAC